MVPYAMLNPLWCTLLVKQECVQTFSGISKSFCDIFLHSNQDTYILNDEVCPPKHNIRVNFLM